MDYVSESVRSTQHRAQHKVSSKWASSLINITTSTTVNAPEMF